MGFWIFMMITNVLIPLTMVGFGKYFIKNAPKEINMIFGYRTTMSMKNKDTWAFAHKYCGKLWLKLGYILLVASAIAMFVVIGKDENVIGSFGGIVCGVQMVFLIGTIFTTEKALRKTFDKDGNKKD